MSRTGVAPFIAAVGLAVAAASGQPDFGGRMDSMCEYLEQDTAMHEKGLETTRTSGALIKARNQKLLRIVEMLGAEGALDPELKAAVLDLLSAGTEIEGALLENLKHRVSSGTVEDSAIKETWRVLKICCGN